MRLNPEHKEKIDLFKHLTPTQNMGRKIAIAFAFAGTFYWLFKIVF